MATKPKDIIARIKDNDIEWVDLRFTDPKGKWQHLTMCAGVIDEDALEDGLMFDGSSIEGWKAINESDMILKPDLDAVYVDPFSATPMLILFCDVVEPGLSAALDGLPALNPSPDPVVKTMNAQVSPSPQRGLGRSRPTSPASSSPSCRCCSRTCSGATCCATTTSPFWPAHCRGRAVRTPPSARFSTKPRATYRRCRSPLRMPLPTCCSRCSDRWSCRSPSGGPKAGCREDIRPDRPSSSPGLTHASGPCDGFVIGCYWLFMEKSL